MMDVNNDRFISKQELKKKLKEVEIIADDKALEKLVRHIDAGPSPRLTAYDLLTSRPLYSDGNGKIDYREFRDFLSLLPTLNIHHIFEHWMDATSFDVGEDVIVPKKGTKAEQQNHVRFVLAPVWMRSPLVQCSIS